MIMVIFIKINFKISHWIPTLQQVTALVTRIPNNLSGHLVDLARAAAHL